MTEVADLDTAPEVSPAQALAAELKEMALERYQDAARLGDSAKSYGRYALMSAVVKWGTYAGAAGLGIPVLKDLAQHHGVVSPDILVNAIRAVALFGAGELIRRVSIPDLNRSGEKHQAEAALARTEAQVFGERAANIILDDAIANFSIPNQGEGVDIQPSDPSAVTAPQA